MSLQPQAASQRDWDSWLQHHKTEHIITLAGSFGRCSSTGRGGLVTDSLFIGDKSTDRGGLVPTGLFLGELRVESEEVW